MTLTSGQVADYIRSSGKMDTGSVRKLFNTLGFSIEATMLGCLAFVRDPVIAITCLIIACSGSGMSLAGRYILKKTIFKRTFQVSMSTTSILPQDMRRF